MALNTETLMLAKQRLKMTSPDPESASEQTSCVDNKPPPPPSLIAKNAANKKNEFLLQEIQNHRLYNTKKDYVLDFLDRSKINPTLIATNSAPESSQATSQKFARSLSSANITPLLTNTEPTDLNNNKLKIDVTANSVNSTSANNPVANYERFPNARSRKNQFNSKAQTSEVAQRAQSSNSRVSMPVSYTSPNVASDLSNSSKY